MTSFSPDRSEHVAETDVVYRSVNRWAVVSLVLGILSVAAAADRMLIFIPIAGLFAGWMALRRLRRFGEVQTGVALARAGIAASLLFGLAGTIFLYVVMNDVPSGYTEVTFEDLQPEPGERVSRYALALQPTMREERKVFIRGYIYPGRRTQGIKEFMLVPTVSHCAFCSTQLRPTDIIRVKLVSDFTVDFKTTEIGVGGRLRVNAASEQAPYMLEADHVQ